MHVVQGQPVAAAEPPSEPVRTQADELADLIMSFDRVTVRLQATQDTLRSEVARLNDELGQANEQLKRSQRLAALGEMAAGISHEVRNPLGSIRLYAKMLRDDLVDRPGERAIAEKIERAVRGLDAVVSDVLAFSADIRVERRPVSAAALIHRAVDACRAEIDASPGVDIDVPENEAEHTDIELSCDADSVVRSLVNLIRNAVEAVSSDMEVASWGPRSEGETGLVRVVCESGTALSTTGKRLQIVAFRVFDSGPGIPPEVVQRIFNPFFTTRASGTGLGLSIVHRIADAHDGRVEVGVGPDGRGACVSLVLPREEIEDELPAISPAVCADATREGVDGDEAGVVVMTGAGVTALAQEQSRGSAA